MATGMPYGLQAMLKDGHKHFSGLQDAVMKNIEACKGLAQITRTSLGPNGGSETGCGRPALFNSGILVRLAPIGLFDGGPETTAISVEQA
jgi:hypothetical protein